MPVYVKCNTCNKSIKKWAKDLPKINIAAYKCQQCTYKSAYIEKTCPVCNKMFSGVKSVMLKKATCSYSCSNTLFRSGENHGNWSEDSYRSTCFLHHEKKCIICDETNIVTVHHYNKNHSDNRPENLVPLCPTHHQYIHSRYASIIIDKVDEYVKMFITKKGD